MKKYDIWREIIASIIVILALVVFVSPFEWWPEVQKSMVVIVMALFIFAFVVCHSRSNDERENFILYLAERTAFISGSLIAMIGLIVQMTSGEIDHWLVLTFLTMTLAKGIGMIYAKIKH